MAGDLPHQMRHTAVAPDKISVAAAYLVKKRHLPSSPRQPCGGKRRQWTPWNRIRAQTRNADINPPREQTKHFFRSHHRGEINQTRACRFLIRMRQRHAQMVGFKYPNPVFAAIAPGEIQFACRKRPHSVDSLADKRNAPLRLVRAPDDSLHVIRWR